MVIKIIFNTSKHCDTSAEEIGRPPPYFSFLQFHVSCQSWHAKLRHKTPNNVGAGGTLFQPIIPISAPKTFYQSNKQVANCKRSHTISRFSLLCTKHKWLLAMPVWEAWSSLASRDWRDLPPFCRLPEPEIRNYGSHAYMHSTPLSSGKQASRIPLPGHSVAPYMCTLCGCSRPRHSLFTRAWSRPAARGAPASLHSWFCSHGCLKFHYASPVSDWFHHPSRIRLIIWLWGIQIIT